MKELASALIVILLLPQTAFGQAPVQLTEAERARVLADGNNVGFVSFCDPIERKVIHGEEVVRFRCPQTAAGIPLPNLPPEYWRVYVATGMVIVEVKPTIKSRLKSVGLTVLAGVILAVIIYGKAQS